MKSSQVSDQNGYKVCMICILESAILKHLRNRQRAKRHAKTFDISAGYGI
jgi:hypothetical protein